MLPGLDMTSKPWFKQGFQTTHGSILPPPGAGRLQELQAECRTSTVATYLTVSVIHRKDYCLCFDGFFIKGSLYIGYLDFFIGSFDGAVAHNFADRGVEVAWYVKILDKDSIKMYGKPQSPQLSCLCTLFLLSTAGGCPLLCLILTCYTISLANSGLLLVRNDDVSSLSLFYLVLGHVTWTVI